MALEKIITYSAAVLSNSDLLEKLVNDTRVAFRPHNPDESNAHIVALSHLDETNLDTTYRYPRSFIESAYDGRFLTARDILWYPVKKFGDASVFVATSEGAIFLPFHTRYNNLTRFTIEAFVRFENFSVSRNYIINEYYWMDATHQGRWALKVATGGDALSFDVYNNTGDLHTLTASGLGLSLSTWYHIRISFEGNGGANPTKISLDGSEIASGNLNYTPPVMDESICPPIAIGGYQRHNVREPVYAIYGMVDEFVMYDSVLPSNYTVQTSALKPFSQASPTVTVVADSGTTDSVWDMSTLAFFLETAFTSENIKIECDADNDNTPSFSGSPITLTATKALTDKTGRYFHIRFTFISDGDTNYTLHSGTIEAAIPTTVPNTASLDELTNVGDGDGITLTITPPASGNYTETQIYYRKYNAISWTTGTTYVGVQGIQGTVNQTGLDDNTGYEFYVVVNYSSLYSAPSAIKQIWCSSGAQPINEQILDEIITTLESITTANGYAQTIHEVSRIRAAALVEFTNWPSIGVMLIVENKDENETVGFSDCHMSINLTAYTNDKTNPAQALLILAGDIQKALMIDHTRSALAIDTEVQVLEKGFNDPARSPSGWIQIDVEVYYRHDRSNPFQ